MYDVNRFSAVSLIPVLASRNNRRWQMESKTELRSRICMWCKDEVPGDFHKSYFPAMSEWLLKVIIN